MTAFSSQSISRRVHPNGPPTRMVQNPGRVHSDLRDSPDPDVQARANRDTPNVHAREQRLGLEHA
jgi:hypothetical protein